MTLERLADILCTDSRVVLRDPAPQVGGAARLWLLPDAFVCWLLRPEKGGLAGLVAVVDREHVELRLAVGPPELSRVWVAASPMWGPSGELVDFVWDGVHVSQRLRFMLDPSRDQFAILRWNREVSMYSFPRTLAELKPRLRSSNARFPPDEIEFRLQGGASPSWVVTSGSQASVIPYGMVWKVSWAPPGEYMWTTNNGYVGPLLDGVEAFNSIESVDVERHDGPRPVTTWRLETHEFDPEADPAMIESVEGFLLANSPAVRQPWA